MTTSFQFPKTNVVECVFCYRQSRAAAGDVYDDYDRVPADRVSKLKRYCYRVPGGLQGQLGVGDSVVVHCQTGYQLAMVVAINALTSIAEGCLAPVVCKVDLSPYIEDIEHDKVVAALRRQLESEKKRLESMVTYELIAEKNPEFKKLLDDFKTMGGEF